MIFVEGNIGAGKTTAIKKLESRFSIFPEPVEKWTLLEDMYGDSKKFSFVFQMQVLISYIDLFKTASKEKGAQVIMERSPWSAAKVFAKMCDWPDHLKQAYCESYEIFSFKPELIIFLDVSPEECLKRVQKRNRSGESKITLEFLEKVNEYYETAFSKEPSFDIVRVSDGDELIRVVENFYLNK